MLRHLVFWLSTFGSSERSMKLVLNVLWVKALYVLWLGVCRLCIKGQKVNVLDFVGMSHKVSGVCVCVCISIYMYVYIYFPLYKYIYMYLFS